MNLKIAYKKIESCDIVFDANIFLKKNIVNILKPIVGRNPVFVFVDKNLYKKMKLELYCKTLKNVLNAEVYILEGGEKTKSLSYFTNYIEKIFKKGVTSNSFVIAIGGGTIIDLAGYIASVIYRGIKFISVPTTLLASADAAISCKNALNLESGKNQLGTYQLPIKVFVETTYIYDFLNVRYFWDGYAEIIKHGIGHSKRLLDYLKENKSIYIQKKIIPKLSNDEKNEFKKDIIKVLKLAIRSKVLLFNKNNNELQPVYHFGHTIGHALEIATANKLFHGEAITIGMLVAIELSIIKNNLKKSVLAETRKLFKKYNLPTSIKKNILNFKCFYQVMKKDKKFSNGKNYFILMNGMYKISNKLTPITSNEYTRVLKKYINK